MTAGLPDSALELRSTVTSQGTLELSLHDVPVPTPATNEVLNRPGMSGDSTSWEGWSHVRWFVEEVPAGAA
jgi:hypothetical protein